MLVNSVGKQETFLANLFMEVIEELWRSDYPIKKKKKPKSLLISARKIVAPAWWKNCKALLACSVWVDTKCAVGNLAVALCTHCGPIILGNRTRRDAYNSGDETHSLNQFQKMGFYLQSVDHLTSRWKKCCFGNEIFVEALVKFPFFIIQSENSASARGNFKSCHAILVWSVA